MSSTKILIIEDDEDLVRGMKIRLSAYGYKVVSAPDAVMATTAAVREKPDVIVLDLGLPGGDGYMVMERLHGLHLTSRIPIVVLTAKDAETARDRAIEAGAAAFLQKPVENEDLICALENALSLTPFPSRAELSVGRPATAH